MLFNKQNKSKNACQLFGHQARQGYDWWWHSFTARHAVTGEERAFFLEFFICNPALQDLPYACPHPVHQLSSPALPSYVMVKVGTWGADACQLHRFWPWKKAYVKGIDYANCQEGRDNDALVTIDDCFLSETASHGAVSISSEDAAAHPEWMCDAGTIRWDLRIQKQVAFNVGYGTSWLMRHLQAFEMFWHAEGMKTAYEGELIFNGERYIVQPENCFGYADKNWGKNFTTPWLWLSSCDLRSELTGHQLTNSVFDIGGGKPCVCGISLPGQLLSAFWYEGQELEFNFSKFWTATRTKFHACETDTEIIWHVEQRNWTHRMVTDIRCSKADMLLVNYESPDGCKRHNRLWNGGTGEGTIELYHHGRLIDRIHAAHVGCEYGEYSPATTPAIEP